MVGKELAGGGRPARLPASIGSHTGVVLYKVAQFAQEQLDRALQPYGFKTRHYSALGVLQHVQPISQQALSRTLRIDPATIVAVVDDLQRLGLVERRRNARDRRLYDLTLTEAGHDMLRVAEVALAEMEDAVFAPLTGDERRDLHALLTRLLAVPE